MDWTLLIGSVGFVALVLTGSWLARWGERRGKRGPLWSVLKVFVALQWLLDALPGDRGQVELPSPGDGSTRPKARPRRRPGKSRSKAKRHSRG